MLLNNRATLLRFLIARLGNAEEAEDALQEAWLKLESAAPPGPIAQPLPYLFRLCENAARDARRSAARRAARESRWAERDADWSDGEAATISPEQIAEGRDQLARLERRLLALPERTRAIFIAFRIDGASQSAIADRHAISVSAVQKHLQRAYRLVAEVQAEENSRTDAGSGSA